MRESVPGHVRGETVPDGAMYRVRKPFRVAVAADLALLSILMALSIFFVGSGAERTALVVIFAVLLLIGIEAFCRRIFVDGEGLVLVKFFRKKRLQWRDITALGCVAVRKKVYFLLTTTKGFHILSNSYERYPDLLRQIIDHIGSEKVDSDVSSYVDTPLWNRSDLVSAWLAAVVMAGLIALKLLFT